MSDCRCELEAAQSESGAADDPVVRVVADALLRLALGQPPPSRPLGELFFPEMARDPAARARLEDLRATVRAFVRTRLGDRRRD